MFSTNNRIYTPALRWKKGEMEALGSLDEPSRDRILPYVVFPSLKARDIEKGRKLSQAEFAPVQVGRLQRFWSGLPFLADFRFLRFDGSSPNEDTRRLDELLAVSRQFGCRLIPVVDANTDADRTAILRKHIYDSGSGLAIRIALSDLHHDSLQGLLGRLLDGVRGSPPESVLVLDLGDATISSAPEFAKFTAEWLSSLHNLGRWNRIIVAASGYPTTNPAKPNAQARPLRVEWQAWRQLAENDRGIAEWASFADYGADHGHIDFDGGGRTIPHLRYATPEDWIVCRGGEETKEDNGTIQSVANRIVAKVEFAGEAYSAGDEFIAQCAAGGLPGNATTWRWANMVDHLTLTVSEIGKLIGLPFERPKRVPAAKQLSLLQASH